MSIHRPIAPARTTPPRLVGDIATREPPHGRLRWRTRIELIVVASALLWGLIVFLIAALF
jgi:hypothetical protein